MVTRNYRQLFNFNFETLSCPIYLKKKRLGQRLEWKYRIAKTVGMDEKKGLRKNVSSVSISNRSMISKGTMADWSRPSSISNSTIPFQSFLGRLDAASASLITD